MGAPLKLPESYRDCLEFLYARNQFSIKLGLDNTHALLDRLGRPQDGLSFLHVAGTNGKGSVCANLEALLRASGFRRVGLYTSPHLVSFRERMLVDGVPVPREWIVTWMRKSMEAIEDLGVTYFEIVTAMAFDWFRESGCEAVVLETGLGGRLDATNTILPEVTAVTSISLDHTQILGDTVEAIWREKIAILKPGVTMVVADTRPHLLAELDANANAAGSEVIRLSGFPWATAGASMRFRGKGGTWDFPADLREEDHQRENLALSLLIAEAFLARRGKRLPPAEVLLPGLRESKVPGRTQLLTETGMLPLVLDGAHNPGGLAALAAWLARAFPEKRILALFSLMRDKDVAAAVHAVEGFSDEARFIPLDAKLPRALSREGLDAARAAMSAERTPGLPAQKPIIDFPLDAASLSDFLRPGPGKPDLVVVCGSLYLLGEVIPLLVPHYRGLSWFRQFEGEVC